MRILFLIPLPQDPTASHLYRKFFSQIECANKITDEVYYTSYEDAKVYFNKYGKNENAIKIGKTSGKNSNFIQMHYIMKAIKKTKILPKFDLIYMRMIAPTSINAASLKRLRVTGAKTVVEIPTFPGTMESKNSRRRYYYQIADFFFKVHKKKYLNNIDLFALIGEQSDSYFGKPAINIENGLFIDSIQIKQSFAQHSNELHLLAVAMVSYWHAYDRVLAGMANYYEYIGTEIKVYLHICGVSNDGSIIRMQELVREKKLDKYVIFHGYTTGTELNLMFDKCDIAIGSLGLHRQNIIFDTTLKLLEYTARGIPFVYATPSRLIDDSNFCMKISQDETPVDIAKVVAFYCRINKKCITQEMRKYAVEHLDWSVQLKRVYDKIESEWSEEKE